MFGARKQPPISTLIGEGTVIEGEIRFTEGLRIDGKVLGSVVALGDERTLLVIGERASIAGKVRAGHIIVNGEIRGPGRSSRANCSNFSPRRASKETCATNGSKCTRARRSMANCAPWVPRRNPHCA